MSNKKINNEMQSVINPITSEEELIVRKYINQQYFEIDKIIEYLNTNSFISKDIFLNYFTPIARGKFNLTYLNSFKEINRDKFIKRIQIYFYDVNLKNEFQPSMTDFFNGYLQFINKGKKIETFNEFDKLYPSDIDFEPLYSILDELIYDYSIDIDRVLNYIQEQRGSVKYHIIFRYWYGYLKLLDFNKINDIKMIFPKNILYSYNVELEKNGFKPIIHFPATLGDDNDSPYVVYRRNKVLNIGGFFPFDDEGNPVFKWIGIWFENVKNIKWVVSKPKTQEHDIQYNSSPSLRMVLKFELCHNTRIFLAYRQHIGRDEFMEEEKFKEYWKLEYCGPSLMKLDCSIITKKREELGYSPKDVSEATGINLRTYQRIEVGEGSPDGLNLIKIMNFLDIGFYDELIKKEEIIDDGFEKFMDGAKLSEFIDEEV